MTNKVELTAVQVKELAELVGFEVKDAGVDDWLPDDSKVTVNQFGAPQFISDEDGKVAGVWDTVATFDEAPENGANPLGPNL